MLHANLAELHVADLCGPTARTDEIAQSLAEIKSAARLTADLLDRLLEYARLDSAEDKVRLGDVPLDGLVRDVMATHALAATAAGLDVSASVPAGAGPPDRPVEAPAGAQ